jgi:hypothetical protein
MAIADGFFPWRRGDEVGDEFVSDFGGSFAEESKAGQEQGGGSLHRWNYFKRKLPSESITQRG